MSTKNDLHNNVAFEGWGEIIEELTTLVKNNHELMNNITSILKIMETRMSALEITIAYLEKSCEGKNDE